MAGVVFPRRVVSTPTTITVSGAPTWTQTMRVGYLETIPVAPADQIRGANCSPTFTAYQVNSINKSDSGWGWNDDYGPGGGMIMTGGGHGAGNFPFVWMFDGSIPGWRPLNVTPPSGLTPEQAYGTRPDYKWDDGSEFSYYAASMPVDAVVYSNNVGPLYYKPRVYDPGDNGEAGDYPTAPTIFYYGEIAHGWPAGFHTYGMLTAIPPGKLGMGAKGGISTGPCKASCSQNSALGTTWGNKIDLETGVWSRMPYRLPAQWTNGARLLKNYVGTWYAGTTDGNYGYWMGAETCDGIVRVDYTTGDYYVIRCNNPKNSAAAISIIPGTNVVAAFGPTNTASLDNNGVWSQWGLKVCNINPALPYTTRNWQFANLDGPNPCPTGNGEMWTGFGGVGPLWVPEIGRFAIFSATDPSTEAGHGAWPWPPKIYWFTPPSNVETTWSTGQWHVEEEQLQIDPTDTLVTQFRVASNYQETSEIGTRTWQKTFWSSKLRGFVHAPSPMHGHMYFIRTAKVP